MEQGSSAAPWGTEHSETAALVALLRRAARPTEAYAELVEEARSARRILEDQEGLLAGHLLDAAAAEVARWTDQGIRLLTLLDSEYPENLRCVFDRPPLLFVAGRLDRRVTRSVAVIGSRRASASGLDRCRAITDRLIDAGYTIVSGLAAGIDTAAHLTALDRGAPTVAVIGTGLMRAYPSGNEGLQRRIAQSGAVLSSFWPEARPTRKSFPARNAVMSGLSLATVVVEATHTSGARTQITAALQHGRPVLLARSLLDQSWAREVAQRPGVEVIDSLGELEQAMEKISMTDALVE